MTPAVSIKSESARVHALGASDPFVRRIRASWRKLTGGRRVRDADRRTLVACSGGADSAALALALAGVGHGAVVVGHVVHDMRCGDGPGEDRDAVARLAESLGLAFVEARVDISALPGNAEENARRARYDALVVMARNAGAAFVATGHHADDQLETLLMRLARGTGVDGLAGIHEKRSLGSVTVVRPALAMTRDACEDACGRAGWAWCKDETNTDESRFRAAVRARITPELRAMAPGMPERIARTCRQMREASELLDSLAARLIVSASDTSDGLSWRRERLRAEPSVVVGRALRRALTERGVGADTVPGSRIDAILSAISEDPSGERVFRFKGAVVTVSGASVSVRDWQVEDRLDD